MGACLFAFDYHWNSSSGFSENIPIHFNFTGHVDRYGSRTELLISSIVIIGVALLLWLSFMFLKKFTDRLNEKIYQTANWITIVTLSIICIVILVTVYCFTKAQVIPDFYKISAIVGGICDIVIANYILKYKQNSGDNISSS
ncbi:DUF1648 domain-containing protein [Caproicibacterium sp. BJN0003]|uniref:DUF1648 domain-containing protein n=1 Tax=Caproicibacterium sp. BJN0003 TaxID=2994078 RepID=UPI003A4C7A6F